MMSEIFIFVRNLTNRCSNKRCFTAKSALMCGLGYYGIRFKKIFSSVLYLFSSNLHCLQK